MIPLNSFNHSSNSNPKQHLDSKAKNMPQASYPSYRQNNYKENVLDSSNRNVMMQIGFNNNGFNHRQSNLFKKNEYAQSSSPPMSSSLPLTSYMNNNNFSLMPLNNIVNQSSKDNTNMNRANNLISYKQNENRANMFNNRNRFNNINNINSYNPNKAYKNESLLSNPVDGFKKQSNDEMKSMYSTGFKFSQQNRPSHVLTSQNRHHHTSESHIVHSSTYNCI